MIVSIHQPGYLPWPGYFHRLALSDVHVFFDDVQYEKHGLNHRNRIKTAQGPQWLTVPVRTRGRFGVTLLKDAEIADDRWRRRHWRSLVQHYRRAPHFAPHAPFFEQLYHQGWERLLPLNVTIIEYLVKALGLKPVTVYASELSVTGQKSDRVFNICRAVGATVYLSGVLGRDYLEVEQFNAAGIGVLFQAYRFPAYHQLYKDHVPNLSVVDLLFNCGPKSLDVLMADNLSRESVGVGKEHKVT